jgi:hypothetical protein
VGLGIVAGRLHRTPFSPIAKVDLFVVGLDGAGNVNASRASLALKRDAMKAVGYYADAVRAHFQVGPQVDRVEARVAEHESARTVHHCLPVDEQAVSSVDKEA